MKTPEEFLFNWLLSGVAGILAGVASFIVLNHFWGVQDVAATLFSFVILLLVFIIGVNASLRF